MPKSKNNKQNADKQSKPKKQTRSNRPKDPDKRKAGKASAAARKAKRESGEPVTRACKARRTDGTPCKNSAIRGGTVCARHGGNAPQVREKANRRLLEMVLPAIRELRKIIDSKKATDADKLRAIQLLLNRTGFSERQIIDVSMREPTEWELIQQTLGQQAVVSFNRAELGEPDDDDPKELGNGQSSAELDAQLESLLAERDRRREREAATRLDNSGHDVIAAEIPDEAPRTAGSRLYERPEG